MQREGTLHIVWLNGPLSDAGHSVTFGDYASPGGSMTSRQFRSVHDLTRYLLEDVGVYNELVNSGLAALRDEGNASIFNVILTDEQLETLELK
jgi:hypothetical protein